MMTGERKTGVVAFFSRAKGLAENFARDLARGYTDNDVAEAFDIISGGTITAEQRGSYIQRRFDSVSGPTNIMFPLGPITLGLSLEVQVNVKAITAEQQRLSGLTPPELEKEVRAEAYARAIRFKLIAN